MLTYGLRQYLWMRHPFDDFADFAVGTSNFIADH